MRGSRYDTKDPIVEEVVPKKTVVKSLDFLDNASIDKFKTGHDLRKDRRESLRQERAKAGTKYTTKPKKASADSVSSNKPRFKLGNGIDALTADSLLGLVKLTTPYYFPENEIRLVLDDEEDVDTSGISGPSSQSIRLAQLCDGQDGWHKILLSSTLAPSVNPSAEERIDYFALCLASHYATCATYVPTDVDSKIRGHCWFDPEVEVLKGQFTIVKHALSWDVERVSKRSIRVHAIDNMMPISGHDGEFLGILAGAWGAFLRIGDMALAQDAEDLIHKELQREADAFHYLSHQPSSVENDTKLLKLAAIMTHNVGDVDQGLSYWMENYNKKLSKLSKDEMKMHMLKYNKLAHERYDRYNGEFVRAKIVYKDLLSAEGHRNYPLREAKCLRNTPDLALPIESWGRNVAKHPLINEDDLIMVIKQLIRGCDSTSKGWCVPNQIGYYRALYGIASRINFDKIMKSLDKDCKAFLKSHDMRLQMTLSAEAFATKLGAKGRDIISGLTARELSNIEATTIALTAEKV